jgi:hypothetical protein
MDDLSLAELNAQQPKFDVSEQAEDAPAPDTSGPLTSRLAAKTPATRKAAYEELAELLREAAAGDACIEEYEAFVLPMLKDKAPSNFEGALDATLAFVQLAPAPLVQPMAAAAAAVLVDNEKCLQRESNLHSPDPARLAC